MAALPSLPEEEATEVVELSITAVVVVVVDEDLGAALDSVLVDMVVVTFEAEVGSTGEEVLMVKTRDPPAPGALTLSPEHRVGVIT